MLTPLVLTPSWGSRVGALDIIIIIIIIVGFYGAFKEFSIRLK